MWSRLRASVGSAAPLHVARPVDDPTLGDILDDVRDLRLHLAADLSAAAGAVDEGEPSVAADFVTADRELIEVFLQRARVYLTADPSAPVVGAPARTKPLRSRRLLPAGPALAAAAALVAVVSGVLPSHSAVQRDVTARPVAESWQRFTDVAHSDASAAQVIAAADQLHESLADLIAAARHDPAKGRQALRLLELERQLVLRDRPAGASVVLAQSQELVVELAALLPGVLSNTPSSAAVAAQPTGAASAPPSPAPSGSRPAKKSKPSSSPTATTSPSAPQPPTTANPAPSPSPTDFNPLPTSPTVPH